MMGLVGMAAQGVAAFCENTTADVPGGRTMPAATDSARLWLQLK